MLQLAPETPIEMICPRCGTSRRPIGPRMRLDGWGRPCLRYACDDCGYSWNESTRDQVPPPQVADLTPHPATARRLFFAFIEGGAYAGSRRAP
jgi:hypothetical protein